MSEYSNAVGKELYEACNLLMKTWGIDSSVAPMEQNLPYNPVGRLTKSIRSGTFFFMDNSWGKWSIEKDYGKDDVSYILKADRQVSDIVMQIEKMTVYFAGQDWLARKDNSMRRIKAVIRAIS